MKFLEVVKDMTIHICLLFVYYLKYYVNKVITLLQLNYASITTYYNLNLLNNNNTQIEIIRMLLLLFIEWFHF